MADSGETDHQLRRLEAALDRIAAHLDRIASAPPAEATTPAFALEPEAAPDPSPSAPAVPTAPVPDETVMKIDEIIGGLRNALGIERDR